MTPDLQNYANLSGHSFSPAPDTEPTFAIPSITLLWADLEQQFADFTNSGSREVLKGIAVLRIKTLLPHGQFTIEVKTRLGKEAETTIRKSRRTAEAYLFLVGKDKPSLKKLRKDPSPLYSSLVSKPGVEDMLAKWGLRFAKEIIAQATQRKTTVAPSRATLTAPLSPTKLQQLRQILADVRKTAEKATPAEKEEIFQEARRLLGALSLLLEPPLWHRPAGPTHYEI
jgi:hypothetical protein